MEKEILKFIQKAVKETKKELGFENVPPVELEVPSNSNLGDISTNIAFRISHQNNQTKEQTQKITDSIVKHLGSLLEKSFLKEDVEKIEDKNGFINFFLSKKAYGSVLLEIKKKSRYYGSVNIGSRKRVLLEFVSANPTGPLNVAHGRQAAIGQALSNILKFLGFNVVKEYYLNDLGRQIDLLGQSAKARCFELMGEEKTDFPEEGYKGQYIYSIAEHLLEKYSRQDLKEKDNEFFSKYSADYILAVIKDDLSFFEVNFDSWFCQSTLSKNKNDKKVLSYLKKKKYVYEKEGAVWFKSTLFGDDKDRVLIKSDGSYTYLTPDIAYHEDKHKRNFKQFINIWGPDHHGYIARLKAACSALGIQKEILNIIIVQLCTLFSGGKPLKMSTREGEFITLRQVIEEVGREAAKFFFLMRKTDSHLDFDLELACKKSLENPIYYIQYAHARICSIMEFREKEKIKLFEKIDLTCLNESEELEMIRTLRLFPQTLINIARTLEPYTLTLYLRKLAGLFHSYYQSKRIVQTDEPKLTSARLFLIDCVRQVLANGLCLLDVSAPEKM